MRRFQTVRIVVGVEKEIGSGETSSYGDLPVITMRCKGSSIYFPIRGILTRPLPFRKTSPFNESMGVSGTEKDPDAKDSTNKI
jgi:hypothetical protein